MAARSGATPTPTGRPAISALLRDLGPQLRSAQTLDPSHASREPQARDALGAPALDGLLEGGIPRGRVLEIAGPASSGRTSLALAWLAGVTRAGEVAAWVDVGDALDPPSAEAAGVVLPRLLWVRAPGLREALRATERLLTTRGFALVVLDLAEDEDRRNRQANGATWLRLSRAAAGARASLALLTAERRTDAFSDLALELRPGGARFSPAPALLEGLAASAVLVRSRLGPPGGRCSLELSA